MDLGDFIIANKICLDSKFVSSFKILCDISYFSASNIFGFFINKELKNTQPFKKTSDSIKLEYGYKITNAFHVLPMYLR